MGYSWELTQGYAGLVHLKYEDAVPMITCVIHSGLHEKRSSYPVILLNWVFANPTRRACNPFLLQIKHNAKIMVCEKQGNYIEYLEPFTAVVFLFFAGYVLHHLYLPANGDSTKLVHPIVREWRCNCIAVMFGEKFGAHFMFIKWNHKSGDSIFSVARLNNLSIYRCIYLSVYLYIYIYIYLRIYVYIYIYI